MTDVRDVHSYLAMFALHGLKASSNRLLPYAKTPMYTVGGQLRAAIGFR